MSETVDLPAIALPAGAYDFDAVNAAAADVLQGREMTPELAEAVTAAVRLTAVPAVGPVEEPRAETAVVAQETVDPEPAGGASRSRPRREASPSPALEPETSGGAAQQE